MGEAGADVSEPLDLEEIKRRMVVHEAQDNIMDALDDIESLISEVERLRAVVWFNALASERRFVTGEGPPKDYQLTPDETTLAHISALYEQYG